MSILNLNASQGRGPLGKKSAKIWMGVGLLAAVLGFGSTFAASITLNTPGGTTEFGQGVTQTVYCGADEQTVTISPTSSYSNADTRFDGKFITSYSSASPSPVSSSVPRVTINGKDSASFPRFVSRSSSMTGWWLSGSSPSSTPTPVPIASVKANPGNYFFAEESSLNSGKYRIPSSGNTPAAYSMYAFDELENFKLGGIVISKIPPACSGVDFIISAYASTGTAQKLIYSPSIDVYEVGANWTADGEVTPTVSKSRKEKSSTSGLVIASQNSTSLTFQFVPGGSGTALGAKDLYKLVVETQEGILK